MARSCRHAFPIQIAFFSWVSMICPCLSFQTSTLMIDTNVFRYFRTQHLNDILEGNNLMLFLSLFKKLYIFTDRGARTGKWNHTWQLGARCVSIPRLFSTFLNVPELENSRDTLFSLTFYIFPSESRLRAFCQSSLRCILQPLVRDSVPDALQCRSEAFISPFWICSRCICFLPFHISHDKIGNKTTEACECRQVFFYNRVSIVFIVKMRFVKGFYNKNQFLIVFYRFLQTINTSNIQVLWTLAYQLLY